MIYGTLRFDNFYASSDLSYDSLFPVFIKTAFLLAIIFGAILAFLYYYPPNDALISFVTNIENLFNITCLSGFLVFIFNKFQPKDSRLKETIWSVCHVCIVAIYLMPFVVLLTTKMSFALLATSAFYIIGALFIAGLLCCACETRSPQGVGILPLMTAAFIFIFCTLGALYTLSLPVQAVVAIHLILATMAGNILLLSSADEKYTSWQISINTACLSSSILIDLYSLICDANGNIAFRQCLSYLFLPFVWIFAGWKRLFTPRNPASSTAPDQEQPLDFERKASGVKREPALAGSRVSMSAAAVNPSPSARGMKGRGGEASWCMHQSGV